MAACQLPVTQRCGQEGRGCLPASFNWEAAIQFTGNPRSEYPETGNLNIQKASPGQLRPGAKTVETGVLQIRLSCTHPPLLVVQGARAQWFSMVS